MLAPSVEIDAELDMPVVSGSSGSSLGTFLARSGGDGLTSPSRTRGGRSGRGSSMPGGRGAGASSTKRTGSGASVPAPPTVKTDEDAQSSYRQLSHRCSPVFTSP